jgi:hypothetical protein
MMGKGNARIFRVFDKIKFGKFVRLFDSIKNKFVTMHDHMKVKFKTPLSQAKVSTGTN